MSDNHFGPSVAADYDQLHGITDPAELRATLDTLAQLAGDGPILEFAIGTGRIALPLAERGLRVSGIELSPDMVAVLRAKPGGAGIEIALGDMTSTRLPGPFALVALLFNTIDNLTTQAAQVACFRNAAAHLAPGGHFVVETLVPPLQRLPFGETLLAFDSESTHLGLDQIDVAEQTYTSRHLWLDGDAHREMKVPFRYAWPAEMDLMAEMAGLRRAHRWSGWRREPFDRFSRKHVSVWVKDPAD